MEIELILQMGPYLKSIQARGFCSYELECVQVIQVVVQQLQHIFGQLQGLSWHPCHAFRESNRND